MTILFSTITEGERARNEKKYGQLDGLKKSIQEIGLIQPIVLAQQGDAFLLVAGGRRYRAMKELGVTELHHGTTLDPDRLGFLFKDEVPDHIRLEAELDENLHRLDMDWIDNALLIYRVHRAKKDKFPKWGQRQTAELLNNAGGVSKVNYALRAAKALLLSDKEVMACSSLDEANCLFTKRKEDEALAELQRRTMPKAPAPTPVSSDLSGLLGLLSAGPSPDDLLRVAFPTIKLTEGPDTSTSKVVIPLSTMFRLGDFINVLSSGDILCDHIVTDIPYGISMDNFNEQSISDLRATHDVDQNIEMMSPFLQLAYRCVKPGGFCVFFYDLDHHEKLQAWAKDAGWKVQRWPYIAAKSSQCQNNAAQFNTTKNYEVAMFLRKDEHTVLRKVITTSWKAYDFAAERKLYNNPFAKPFDLWKDIYDAIAFPGQSILDPFCGEMSACRAAANCGLTPFGVELDEGRYNRGLDLMRSVYSLIHKSNVEFV